MQVQVIKNKVTCHQRDLSYLLAVGPKQFQLWLNQTERCLEHLSNSQPGNFKRIVSELINVGRSDFSSYKNRKG